MEPVSKFNSVDGVFVRQMHFLQQGDVMEGHTHNHNHMTLLARGSMEVTVEGETTKFVAPKIIFIHKDHVHKLTALEDNTLAYCIHAIRDADTGEIIDDIGVPFGIQHEPLVRS